MYRVVLPAAEVAEDRSVPPTVEEVKQQLGWTPPVLSQAGGQQVEPGDPVPTSMAWKW